MDAFVAAEDELHDSPIQTNAKLVYYVDDSPTWALSFFLAIQHFLTTAAAALTFPLLLGSTLCILERDPVRDQLVSTIFFVSGISTLLQITFGIRLPVVQGSSIAFTACFIALLQLPHWTCPPHAELYAMGAENRTAEWQDRMREIQGALISVSLLEMFIGYSGLVGFILRFTSPLIMAPTVSLLSLSLVPSVAENSRENWYIAFVGFLTLIIIWQYLGHLSTPIPWYTLANGWHVKWLCALEMFPILLCTLLVSVVCWILASCNILELKKIHGDVTDDSFSWFQLPYPFQWGLPRFSGQSILAATAAMFISIVMSSANYYSCAAICGKPPPPLSAVSRGIGTEGLCSLVAGLFGTGTGITTVTSDIASIGITKVGNRRVTMIGATIMMSLSFLPHVRGVLFLIPPPLIGSLLGAMLAISTSIGKLVGIDD